MWHTVNISGATKVSLFEGGESERGDRKWTNRLMRL